MNRDLISAAKALLSVLPQPGSKEWFTHYARLEADALRKAVAKEEALIEEVCRQPLSMSMFATKADFENAVRTQTL